MMPLPWRHLLPALLAFLLIQSPSAAAEAPAAGKAPATGKAPAAGKEKALVAVAANFKSIAESLATEFQATSGHEVVLVSGSTGKLYTQITNGAPFHIFLAADSERPARLYAEGISLGPPRTYATGRLGIWIRDSASGENHSERLADLRRVALANPSLAPYGSAAMDVVDQLALRDRLEGRLAYGENVAQAYALVAAGAADGGERRDRIGGDVAKQLVPERGLHVVKGNDLRVGAHAITGSRRPAHRPAQAALRAPILRSTSS